MRSRSSSVLAAIVIFAAGPGCLAGFNRQGGSSIMADTVPRILAEWLWPFVGCFTASTWNHVLALVAGAVLCPGRRTVTAALRVMGLDQTASFAVYHRVLSTARWSARLAARQLLLLLVIAFVPQGPVIIPTADPMNRRWAGRSGCAVSTVIRCAPATASSSRS